jgi:hypothetical protein
VPALRDRRRTVGLRLLFFLYVCRSGGCSWRVNGGLDDGCVDVKGRS